MNGLEISAWESANNEVYLYKVTKNGITFVKCPGVTWMTCRQWPWRLKRVSLQSGKALSPSFRNNLKYLWICTKKALSKLINIYGKRGKRRCVDYMQILRDRRSDKYLPLQWWAQLWLITRLGWVCLRWREDTKWALVLEHVRFLLPDNC